MTMTDKKIAPSTKKRLKELVSKNIHLGAARVVDAIEGEFGVTRRAAPPRPVQPTPVIGQQWRNRASGRLVKVTEVPQGWGPVKWACVDGSRGPKSGSVYRAYWDERFDFVKEAN